MPEQRNDINKKFFAFISYSSANRREAARLHRRLEYFRVTGAMARDFDNKRKPMNPSFYAPLEIQPGELKEELKTRLRNSRYLVVVCSPESARSQWVQLEIDYFVSIGRRDKIFFFIVDGKPNSGDPATDCYGKAVKDNGLEGVLGVDVHENVFKFPPLNRERAYIQLISRLLGVDFDTLWNRHLRRLRRKIACWSLAFVALAAAFFFLIRSLSPYDAEVRLVPVPENDRLYAGDGKFYCIIDNDTVTEDVGLLDGKVILKNLPGKYKRRPVRCVFNMFGFESLDTVLILPEGLLTIPVSRNHETYGRVEGQIRNESESPLAGAVISAGGVSAVSDPDGRFRIDIPIERQNSSGYDATVISNGKTLRVTLYPMRENPENFNLIYTE